MIEKIPNFGEFSLRIIITGFDKILLILAYLAKPKPRILDNRSIYFVLYDVSVYAFTGLN